MVTQLAASYVQDADLADPRLSPIDADLSQLPPLMVHAATDEVLFPSARALAERATKAGVRCEFQPIEDSVHSFVLFPFLPEAARALETFARFARRAPAGVSS
jgi:acetyl esterase/lipase